MPLSKEKLGNLITQIDKRNKNTQLGIDCVRGISVKKVFTATKADLYGVSLNNHKIVPPQTFATVYKGNIIKNLIMDCQSYTKYRPNETTGGIFVSWRRKEELPTGA